MPHNSQFKNKNNIRWVPILKLPLSLPSKVTYSYTTFKHKKPCSLKYSKIFNGISSIRIGRKPIPQLKLVGGPNK